MRGFALLATLLAIGVTATALATHDPAIDCCHDCPEYTQSAPIADGYGLAWNEGGQFLLTFTAQEDPVIFWTGPQTFYLAFDDPSLAHDPLAGPLFAVWLYEETGHRPGLQRNDEACAQAHGPEADSLVE